jgi:hypothetical protein
MAISIIKLGLGTWQTAACFAVGWQVPAIVDSRGLALTEGAERCITILKVEC